MSYNIRDDQPIIGFLGSLFFVGLVGIVLSLIFDAKTWLYLSIGLGTLSGIAVMIKLSKYMK